MIEVLKNPTSSFWRWIHIFIFLWFAMLSVRQWEEPVFSNGDYDFIICIAMASLSGYQALSKWLQYAIEQINREVKIYLYKPNEVTIDDVKLKVDNSKEQKEI